MRTTVKVPSLSKEGLAYPVTRDGDRIDCKCIRFEMSPQSAKFCTHTALVVRADTLLEKCAERHGLTDPPSLCRQCVVALLAISSKRVKQLYMLKTEAKEKIAAARKKRSRKKKVKNAESDGHRRPTRREQAES
jgi:hypothetical protein